MKMLFGNMDVSSFDGTFEMLPEVFQPVDVAVTANIFLKAVLNFFVGIASAAQRTVSAVFVSVAGRTLGYIFLNDRKQGLLLRVFNDPCHHFAVTLQHPEHDGLASGTTATLAGVISAHIRFINFDIARKLILPVNHRHMLANLMADAPRGFVSHAKLALQFFARYAVTRGGEQIDRVEPQLERSAAVFERSANSRVNMMSAPLAGKSAFSFDAIPFRGTLALGANIRLAKANFEQVLQAGLIVRELSKKLTNRYAVLVAIVSHATRMPKMLPYVKGINPKLFDP